MGHAIVLGLQLFFLLLFVFIKINDYPGVYAISIFSWAIPIAYYLSSSVIVLSKRLYKKSLVYLIFTFLIVCIPNKIWFFYHNIFIHALLIFGFALIYYKFRELQFNKSFKIMAVLILVLNLFLLPLSDNFISENGPNYTFKSFASGQPTWDNFEVADSLKDGFGADIDSYISYRVNRVFNFTSATAVAKMDVQNSHVRANIFDIEQNRRDGLFRHEYYHFKITELVTRQLNIELKSHHFAEATKTKKLIRKYVDRLESMQKVYDKETNHNLLREKQKEWEKKIDNMLEMYK